MKHIHIIAFYSFLIVGAVLSGQVLGDAPNEADKFYIESEGLPRAMISGEGHRADAKPRGTLFMCHGFLCNREMCRDYMWIHDRLNWNVVLFDFRNFGPSSSTLPLYPPSLGYYEIWDVKAVVNWAEQHGYERPYAVMGFSMGAAIGLRWAGQDERIAGVWAESPFRTAWEALTQAPNYMIGTETLVWQKMVSGAERMLREVDSIEAVSHRRDLRVWVVAGENDMFPIAQQREIVDASPSPKSMKRFWVVPGRGHAPFWDWKPDHDKHIEEFLAQCRD